MKNINDTIKNLQDIMDIQLNDPIIYEEPYFHGLANGLILAKHIIENAKGSPGFIKWTKQEKIERELAHIINCNSLENIGNVPDYLLAKVAYQAIRDFGRHIKQLRAHEGLTDTEVSVKTEEPTE